MSKLFDQLKDAARDREGGLLMGALAKKQAEEAAAAAAASASGPVEPSPSMEPSRAPPPPSPVAPPAAAASPAPAPANGSPLGGIALAVAIFGIAVLAWHSAPWRAPQKMKIEPESLKLDRSFMLDRPPAPSKGTTSPQRPS